MRSFKEYLTEASNLYPIKEDEPHKRRRLNSDYNTLITVDAKKFKRKYELDHDEPLNWKEARLVNLRKLVSAGTQINDHPIASMSERGQVNVGDGRHRISHAAELGMKIKIAVPKEDQHKFKELQ